jgi:putative methyltransferase (TIGR04325 family)
MSTRDVVGRGHRSQGKRDMKALAKYVFRLMRDSIRYAAFGYSQRRGVFQTFAEANLAASGKRIGYNHRDVAVEFGAALTLGLDSSEYPVLFHLKRIATNNCTLLDFGGNVGDHFLRYKKYLDPVRIHWTVCDLPEITRVGREVCNGASNVEFINEVDDFHQAGIDIFLGIDSLQYAEIASPDFLLQKLITNGKRPTHLLLDQLPLIDGRQYVTLQNGGLVRYPHHVYNRDAFISAILRLGYDLVDHWENHCFSCVIPFHIAESVSAFSGLYFLDREAKGSKSLTRTA